MTRDLAQSHFQLRIYSVKPGAMADWLREWSETIRPLRERLGFQVVGAWTVGTSDRFVWILRYDGPDTWEAADRAYYESPERKAIEPDPARHLSATEHYLMTAVDITR